MKTVRHSIFKLLPAMALVSTLAVGAAYGQSLQPNQTYGYSGGKIELFTYEENFDCVDQPTDDLDYNKVPAESGSAEFQTPICQAGIQSTIDPTGAAASTTAVLYVLVPMFSVNSDQNPNDAIACPPGVRLSTICGAVLGKTLIKLFGAVPEGFKTKPMVYTDCPNPGAAPGTCTMHSSTIDLGKVLVALGKLPGPAGNVFLPSPNHSHVIKYSGATGKPIWWEVEPVLVLNLADWPTKDGSSGITSVAALQVAEKAGEAVQVPSNFYLFFSSQPMSNSMMDMR